MKKDSTDGKVKLALTWTPGPRHHHIDLQMSYAYHKQFLKKLASCCESIEVYPEFNTSGNLHYHACIVLDNKYSFYKSALPTLKYKGFTCVKEWKTDKWREYCQKDMAMMCKALKRELPLTKEYYKDPTEVPILSPEEQRALEFGIPSI